METENSLQEFETADALVIINILRKDPEQVRYRVSTFARDDERNIVSMDHVFRAWVALGSWMMHHTDKEDEFFHLTAQQRAFLERIFHESIG